MARYVPEYKITINDREIPAALRSSVSSVRYQEGTNIADRVEIGIANVDLRWLREHIRGLGFGPSSSATTGGPRLVNDAVTNAEGLLDFDNKLTLALGYVPAPLDDVFIGEVTGIEASFPSGGMPMLTIVAHDYLQRLAQGTYARGFGPLPEFLIASILSAEHRLIPVIEASVIAASTAVTAINLIFNGTGIKQKGQSDLELMTKIAATYDAEFWVEGDTFYMARFTKEYSPRLTLTWGENLLDFTPKISGVGQVAGVAMRFTVRPLPLDFVITAFWDFDRESLGVTVAPGVGAPAKQSGVVFTIIDRLIGSPADITNSALAIVHELRSKINKRLTGSGSVIGDPRIRAGAMIRLEGLGPDFSGNYRVSSANHTIDSSGYRTSFEVFKEILL
jgi:phage protein D